MTVKLYEGCYGVTRGGEGDPQRMEGPITYDLRTSWPAYSFVYEGRLWTEDGTRAYGYTAGDIIAVFPTREGAEAHLTGEKLDLPLGHKDNPWPFEPDPAPKPVTWPDGVGLRRHDTKILVQMLMDNRPRDERDDILRAIRALWNHDRADSIRDRETSEAILSGNVAHVDRGEK